MIALTELSARIYLQRWNLHFISLLEGICNAVVGILTPAFIFASTPLHASTAVSSVAIASLQFGRKTPRSEGKFESA